MPRTAAKPSAKTSARRTGTPARAVKSKTAKFQATKSQAPKSRAAKSKVLKSKSGKAKAAGREAGGGALGSLPEWNLADLYVGLDDPEVARDLSRAESDSVTFENDFKGKLADLAGND